MRACGRAVSIAREQGRGALGSLLREVGARQSESQLQVARRQPLRLLELPHGVVRSASGQQRLAQHSPHLRVPGRLEHQRVQHVHGLGGLAELQVGDRQGQGGLPARRRRGRGLAERLAGLGQAPVEPIQGPQQHPSLRACRPVVGFRAGDVALAEAELGGGHGGVEPAAGGGWRGRLRQRCEVLPKPPGARLPGDRPWISPRPSIISWRCGPGPPTWFP